MRSFVYFHFDILIACWCQKCLTKTSKTLHANISLLYSDRTSEKAREISVKLRKSIRELSMKFDMFSKSPREISHFLRILGWTLHPETMTSHKTDQTTRTADICNNSD